MPRLLFDKRDYQLLSIVNDVLSRGTSQEYMSRLIYGYLHPRGIKEMAESMGLRIAYAVIHLFQSLEAGGVDERLSALRSLHDEIISTSGGTLPKNTARVLLQIIKDLVRAYGDTERQLQLAHDFRRAVTGNPRVVRSQLQCYHLLEMPETWSQVTFDDHVHDANTKGRKSSCHLIMDAWIKGIRRLRVIYYNYLEPRFAVELIEAAQIMGIDLRIGIEFFPKFRNKYVHLIWFPRGFVDSQDFLCFLAEDPVIEFMAEGKKVSEHQKGYVLSILGRFNARHRHTVRETYGFEMPETDETEFLSFVGTGQASLLHLAQFLHQKMLPIMVSYVEGLKHPFEKAGDEEKHRIIEQVEKLNKLDPETIFENYLDPKKNPDIPGRNSSLQESADVPELLQISPKELINRLVKLHAGQRFTLNLSHLEVEDFIELIYDCEGMITRLEIFNLKDFTNKKFEHIPEISRFQEAINLGNVIQLKRMIREAIFRTESSDLQDRADRIEKLTSILNDIDDLQGMYKGSRLKSRIGSDSTGRSPRLHGMGFAVMDTLPHRAQIEIKNPGNAFRQIIPIKVDVYRRTTFIPRLSLNPIMDSIYRFANRIPGMRFFCQERLDDWLVKQSQYLENKGNVVTLGGVNAKVDNGLALNPPPETEIRTSLSWNYLNTGIKNGLKVLIGFIPAFATFALTKDWWFLAYFGAFIWFGITGLRNILQSVLGGGGIRRSPLMKWDDYVSWERVTDSLLFTGFSVPLLDYLTKTVLLKQTLGITTASNPVLLYVVMAIVNGLYLSTHNAFRGFPKEVVIANFFRSVFSIPVAIGINIAAGGILGAAGVVGVNEILQKWAAIISKTASDSVAGIIEGLSDRRQHIQIRLRDYKTKLAHIFETYAKLELFFPEVKTMDLLKHPEKVLQATNEEVRDLEKIMIIHALDLLYFWMYQPRARSAIRSLVQSLSNEEQRILLETQFVLLQKKKISLLFVDGLVGKNFSKALAFYLDRSNEYLDGMKKIITF